MHPASAPFEDCALRSVLGRGLFALLRLCFLLPQPAGPWSSMSPLTLSSTTLFFITVATLAGYLNLALRRRNPRANIWAKGILFTPKWTPPWDSYPGRTFPRFSLVFPVTNDSVTLVLFTFCSLGLEAASVEN